jgi:hypothetical protein
MKVLGAPRRNPKNLGRFAFCLLTLGFSLSEWSSAATVTYVGSETGSAGNGYSVQNWSNSGVAKAWNVSSSEVYGSAGYFQIRPMAWDPGSANINEAAGSGNLLGTNAGTNPTLSSTPSFLSSITGGAGSFVNYPGYGIFRGPDGSSLVRQGALSVAVNNGPYNSPAGANASYFGIAMSFTLNAPAQFRLGLAVDSVGSGDYAPNYISISNVFSGALTRDGSADMVFFDIQGISGDSFDVALWQNAGAQPGGQAAALSLVTYDTIPEPSTGLLVLVGMGCLAIHSRRRL